MANTEREALWLARVAQWRDSGQSQRAFALNQGYPQRQLNYWSRRLSAVDAAPALLPLSVQRLLRSCLMPRPFAGRQCD